MSAVSKLKQSYTQYSNKIEAIKITDKIMIALVIILVPPFIFFYFIYPRQASQIKKNKISLEIVRSRYDTLKNEAGRIERNAEEIKNAGERLKQIDALALEPGAGVQFINAISYNAVKNGLDIKFIKKTAKYDQIYQKSYAAFDEAGNIDESSRFNYKLLPVEITFRSSSADMIAFFNMLEGFKKVNYLTRRINAVRTDDGNCEVSVILELLIEVKFS
jgi:hypothetical protein